MKYMFASDLHGSAYYTEKLINLFEKINADKLVLLGDLLYHGPRNELPKGYDTKAVAKMLNQHKQQILAVRGNCDAEVDQMVLEFPILSDSMLLDIDGCKFFCTHGHIFTKENPPMLQAGDILMHGHTHVPAWEGFGKNNYYCNPGSVSIPKEGSAFSCLCYECGVLTWMDLEGKKYKTAVIER